jgi:Flp pilus assembly protein TadD
MHRPGTALVEGDIAFACSIFPNRPYFFIDDASLDIRALIAVIQQVKTLHKFACFVLGERKNDWRQSARAPKATEFEIKPLSDAEIERLLACLTAHGELGELGMLTRELQIAAIQQKHEHQLLVVLREATEGKAFDAIIEGEYQRLPTLARLAYSAVSAAYQLRQSLRDNVLASVVDTSLTDFYAQTNDPLSGVVDFESVDDARGVYAARCRHHTIAEIVWERCVPPEEREIILLDLIKGLNLAYPVDASLFEQLVQSDLTVDVFRSLDKKTIFFEEACKKQPTNPYVRQHYSRMLIREKKLELALNEINSALDMSPNAAPLHHTRGNVLSKMTLAAESTDIARRRMVQAESAFREAIRRRPRDAFPYHGLADLYFNWAKRFANDQEAVDYIGNAERTVAEGLRNVRDRERLLILSSEIQAWLGNQPRALSILEKAVVTSVGVFILARQYLELDRPEKAKKLLEPALLKEPTNERLAMLYAKSLLELGGSYKEAIVILKLAELYGMRDPRYVTMLGGLYFLNGDFSDAEEVFRKALRHRFPVGEQQAITFRPRDPADKSKPLRYTGKVFSAQQGYAYIQVPGLDAVFCRRLRLRGRLLSNDHVVAFSLAFNARGPVADNLELIERAS